MTDQNASSYDWGEEDAFQSPFAHGNYIQNPDPGGVDCSMFQDLSQGQASSTPSAYTDVGFDRSAPQLPILASGDVYGNATNEEGFAGNGADVMGLSP